MSIARWLVLSLLVAACGSDVSPSPSEAPASPSIPASPSSPPSSQPTPSGPPSPTPTPTPSASTRSYELSCGEFEPADCEARAAEVIAYASRQYPRKTIVSLRFTGTSGSYHLMFDDGTAMVAIVD